MFAKSFGHDHINNYVNIDFSLKKYESKILEV